MTIVASPGTSKPARVRLEPEQAVRYARMLRDERHRLVTDRAIARSHDYGLSELNREIEAVERMQRELERAVEERGWDLD